MKSDNTNLFSSSENTRHQPLAYRMRPRHIDEFIGQDHIVGTGRLLRRAIQADQLSSVIFYGPPGTGKTTLARVIANTTKSAFISLNAVLSGVKEVRESIDEAVKHRDMYDRKTILFVDEVHRWNKAQQDALLPWVENGTVVLIGATTENPYFEVNQALVSRSRIFQLKPLTDADLLKVARAALGDAVRGYGRYKVIFDDGALEHLVRVASGDARTLLNALELAVETTPESFPPPGGEEIRITMQAAEESIQKKVVLYDKEGDYHFDTISAFIKSLRGSDPDAALYWLARMVEAGEDPRFIFRRMIISASEDVGLANPLALVVVQSAAAAFDRIGMPEGQFPLAEAALYLATSPKSNSAMGFFDALSSVREEKSDDVPSHLKDSNRDKNAFGHGEGYIYPHAYRDHWVSQQYLPDILRKRFFYKPSTQGYEEEIRDRVIRRRELQFASMVEENSEEILTFSPDDGTRERWLRRVEGGRTEELETVREKIFSSGRLLRHHRVLVEGETASGTLLWEAFRRTPEGWVFCTVYSAVEFDRLKKLSQTLEESERPEIILKNPNDQDDFRNRLEPSLRDIRFEAVFGKNLIMRTGNRGALVSGLKSLLSENGRIVLAELLPSKGERISSLVSDRLDTENIRAAVIGAENELYSSRDDPRVNWDSSDIEKWFKTEGFSSISIEEFVTQSPRTLRKTDLELWFREAPDGSGYGSVMREKLSAEVFSRFKTIVFETLENRTVQWKRIWILLTAELQP